jgi:glycosyltransferase involved in cell wall biosynthesis
MADDAARGDTYPLAGERIVCISSIDWDFNWQGHHEIMATLASEGSRVLFVENTGVRAPELRDLPRLARRLRNWRRGAGGLRTEQANLSIYSPLILPFPYSPAARRINRTLLMRPIRRWLRDTGGPRPIAWTFLPTPLTRDAIAGIDPELVVYFCVDDLPASSPGARRVGQSEAELFRSADLVLVTSERLARRALRYRDRVHLFPFGVGYRQFERERLSLAPPPAEVRDLPRPRVGYLGGVNPKVDQVLLAGVARRLPDASFVLVGPIETDVSTLRQCPNIRLLGPRPHVQVPAYLKAFDVAVVPYRLTDYTAAVYPAKLNEYLAMGLPVVATDLLEIRRLNAVHGSVVRVASDEEAFAAAVREVAGAGSSEDVARRLAVARQNDWTTRIPEIERLVKDALVARRARARLRTGADSVYSTTPLA